MSSFDIFQDQMTMAKADIYGTLWDIEYKILKASSTAEDFYFLMNKVPFRDLHLFVLKAFLEK